MQAVLPQHLQPPTAAFHVLLRLPMELRSGPRTVPGLKAEMS